MTRLRARFILALAVLAATALAGEMTFEERSAIQDSLYRMPMCMRSRWLAKHGIGFPEWTDTAPAVAESGGLRLVGKWGRGPAVEVTGRDSLIFLALGSEVAILNVADTANPRVLSEIQSLGLVLQVALRDSVLYVACRQGYSGIEVWNIADPSEPVFCRRVPTRLSDFCVQDSFAYVTTKSSPPFLDTFKVYGLADPTDPQLLGWCRDSGDQIAASGGNIVVGDWGSIHIMDVYDPAHPRRSGTIGVDALGIAVRGNLVCAARYWNGDADDFWLDAFDISNPASPRLLSEMHGVGGYDIHLDGPLAFVSGFYYDWELQIVDISDSTRPTLISTCDTPGWHDGVWADLTTNRAYVADDDRGLTVVDISNLNSPTIDTALVLAAGLAVDVSLHDTLMYVATWTGGMQIVNVADPARPVSIAEYDSVGYHSWDETVVATDSFAFVGDVRLRPFRVLDVTDPRTPRLVGAAQGGFNPALDLVLRESLLYAAENGRFQVFDVARPSQPVLVGSCDGGGYTARLVDTLAYVASSRAHILSIASPSAPRRLGDFGRGVWDVQVRDTIAFLSTGSVLWYSVSDPSRPRLIDTINLGHTAYGLAVVDDVAYAGSFAPYRICAIDVSDLHAPEILAQASTPALAKAIEFVPPYLYASCSDGGVCIFETTHTAVAEPMRRFGQRQQGVATVVRGAGWMNIGEPGILMDAAGRRVAEVGPGRARRNLAPGVYFVRETQAQAQAQARTIRKVVVVR